MIIDRYKDLNEMLGDEYTILEFGYRKSKDKTYPFRDYRLEIMNKRTGNVAIFKQRYRKRWFDIFVNFEEIFVDFVMSTLILRGIECLTDDNVTANRKCKGQLELDLEIPL